MKIKERDIQRQILEYLKYRKDIYFIRNNTGSFKIIRTNGSQGYCQNAQKGSPDIILCYKGIFIGLEIKTKIGKQSEYQKQAELDIKKCGGKYFIIRCLEDVVKLMEKQYN